MFRCVKNVSSRLTTGATPPACATTPARSCGTYHVYCSELPSMKPVPSVTHAPADVFGWIAPVEQVVPVAARLQQRASRRRVAERRRKARHREIAHRVFERVRGGLVVARRRRHIAEPVVVRAAAHHRQAAPGAVLFFMIDSAACVEVRRAERMRIRDDDRAGITGHHGRLGIEVRPARERAARLRIEHERLHDVAGPHRIEQRLQLDE